MAAIVALDHEAARRAASRVQVKLAKSNSGNEKPIVTIEARKEQTSGNYKVNSLRKQLRREAFCCLRLFASTVLWHCPKHAKGSPLIGVNFSVS